MKTAKYSHDYSLADQLGAQRGATKIIREPLGAQRGRCGIILSGEIEIESRLKLFPHRPKLK